MTAKRSLAFAVILVSAAALAAAQDAAKVPAGAPAAKPMGRDPVVKPAADMRRSYRPLRILPWQAHRHPA